MKLEILKDADTNLIFAHLQSAEIEMCLQEMRSQQIEYVILNSAFGWKEGADLSFLQNNKWIKGIRIVNDVCELSQINHLSNLKYFGGVGKFTGELDLSNFADLFFLAFEWNEDQFKNFQTLKKLEHLRITKYQYTDLKMLDHLSPTLKKLYLFYSNKLTTLEGLENFKFLDRIYIYSAPNLKDINALKGIKNSLITLAFELCKKIEDFTIMDSLLNLQTLVIQKSAPLQSVQFVKKMKNLRYAYIGSEVLDGDVEILKERKIEYKKLKKYDQ